MSFFSLLLALVLEQVRPLLPHNLMYQWIGQWTAWVARTFDAGIRNQAWVTWGITILTPALLAMLVHWALEWVWSGSLFAFAKMCNLRLDSHTQKEATEVAELIHQKASELFPISWRALVNG